MKRFVMLTGAALFAATIATPAAFAETNARTQQDVVVETQEIITTLESTCTLTQLQSKKGCNVDTNDGTPKYPTAPVFPQFGI